MICPLEFVNVKYASVHKIYVANVVAVVRLPVYRRERVPVTNAAGCIIPMAVPLDPKRLREEFVGGLPLCKYEQLRKRSSP